MPTSTPSTDDDLIGADLGFGATTIGHVDGIRRDPVSGRVWQLIASYGSPARRVAVPMEWVAQRSPTRVTLAVGAHSLDDLVAIVTSATV